MCKLCVWPVKKALQPYIYIHTMCHALAVPLEVISVEVIPGQAAVNKKYFLLWCTIRHE